MADSIPASWIAAYLVDVGEMYGVNISSAPRVVRSRRAQLTKFLTFGDTDDEHAPIWARISDKAHVVPVRFTSEAIEQYRRDPTFRGKSLTEHRTAMIMIKDFRPAFGRVPQGGNKGMTTAEYLYLDVDGFSLKGSYDEDTWGSPKEVHMHPQLKEWIEGLRQPGGSGNVLMLRKEERDAQQKTLGIEPALQDAQRSLQPRSGKHILSARKTIQPVSPHKFKSAITQAPKNKKKSTSEGWSYLKTSDARKRIARLPSEILEFFHRAWSSEYENLAPLAQGAGLSTPREPSLPPTRQLGDSAFEADIVDDESRPTTPQHWSPSVRANSPVMAPVAEAAHEAEGGEEPDARATIPPSPPARRRMVDPTEDTLVDENPPSSWENSGEKANGAVSQPPSSKLHSSSIPVPTPAQRPVPQTSSSPAIIPETPIPAAPPGSPANVPQVRPITRRVPIPRVRRISADPNMSAGRILVPNSDTSCMASTQSQSQPRSQLLTQPDPSSQMPSQQSDIVPDPSYMHLPPRQRSQQSLSYTSGSHKQGESQSQSQHSGAAPTHHSLSYTSRSKNTTQSSKPNNESQGDGGVFADGPTEPLMDATCSEEAAADSEQQRDKCTPTDRPPEPAVPSSPVYTGLEDDSATEDEGADDKRERLEPESRKIQQVPSRSEPVHPLAHEEEESQSQTVPLASDLRNSFADEEESQDQHGLPPAPTIALPQEEEESQSQTQSQKPSFQPRPSRKAARRRMDSDEEDEEDQLNSDQEDELDSDDARTKAMVDSTREPQASQGVKRKLLEVSTSRRPAAVPSGFHSDNQPSIRDLYSGISMHSGTSQKASRGPLRPSSPDVFFSDVSFHASQDNAHKARSAEPSSKDVSAKVTKSEVETPDSAPIPARVLHFPEAWRAPAFMSSSLKGKDKDKAKAVEPTKPIVEPHPRAQKRTIEEVSSPEEAPMKKLKVSAPTIEVQAQLELVKKPDSRRTSALKTGRPASQSSDAAQRDPVKGKKVVPPRAISSGSNASSHAKQQDCHDKSIAVSSGFKEARAAQQVTVGSSNHQVKHVNFERESSAATDSRKTTGFTEKTAPRQAAPFEATSRDTTASRLLGGYAIDWTMQRTDNGPPLITWPDLQDILLRTGRIRTPKVGQIPRQS